MSNLFSNNGPRYNALLSALLNTQPRPNALSTLVGKASSQQNAMASPFSDWRRREAWIQTAGSEHAPWCRDHYDTLLMRDAPAGSLHAWDADHIIPLKAGGPDVASNLRAVSESRNRSDGARLGNLLRPR